MSWVCSGSTSNTGKSTHENTINYFSFYLLRFRTRQGYSAYGATKSEKINHHLF